MSSNKPTNSKLITIFRINSFMSTSQTSDVTGYLSTMHRSIGSNYEGGGSKRVSSGLSFSEENLLLPILIEVDKGDREFTKKRTEFYCDIDTVVDYTHGRTLEIGLESSNTDKVSETNMPINIMDYIRYRHALKHPYVAESKELAEGNQTIQFYIFDKNTVEQKSTKLLQVQDAALKNYLELEGNAEKVSQILTLLGVSIVSDKGLLTPGEQRQALKTVATKTPQKFIEIYNTKEFEINFWITDMLNSKVLKQLGGKFFESQTDTLLASSLEEMIWFFKDDLNSDRVISLKAQHQEKKK